MRPIDVERLAGGDDTRRDCRGPAAIVASVENPVLSFNRNPAQTALSAVVIGLQIAVFAVANERFPIRPGIGDDLAFRAPEQDMGLSALQLSLARLGLGPTRPTRSSTRQPTAHGSKQPISPAAAGIVNGRIGSTPALDTFEDSGVARLTLRFLRSLTRGAECRIHPSDRNERQGSPKEFRTVLFEP